jgi:glutamine synthetase
MTASDVLKLAKEKGAQIVDLRFIDMPGLWQHFSIPVAELSAELFAEGIGFDGSSIRGFQAINESDMLLFPDPSTAQMDPFTGGADARADLRREGPRDGRQLRARPALRREEGRGVRQEHGHRGHDLHRSRARVLHLRRRALRPGLQLRLLPRQRRERPLEQRPRGTPESPNLGYRARAKQGYFPVAPADHHQDLRSEMVLNLESVGVKIEVHHHEVASAGQTEIDMRFDTLVKMADKVLWYKYVTKNTAKKHGKTVTFMPKPIFMDNGSGMHTHQSLWKGGKNLFYARAATRTSPRCASTTSEAS